jgi:hypothetical protein
MFTSGWLSQPLPALGPSGLIWHGWRLQQQGSDPAAAAGVQIQLNS